MYRRGEWSIEHSTLIVAVGTQRVQHSSASGRMMRADESSPGESVGMCVYFALFETPLHEVQHIFRGRPVLRRRRRDIAAESRARLPTRMGRRSSRNPL